MRKHTHRLVIAATFAATLITTAALAASPVKITNCYKAASRPKSVTLTCGDGNTYLTGLRWSSFGGASAAATGTFATDTCSPNCAQGKTIRFPVTVKASDPRRCKHGLRVYGRVKLKFTGRRPPLVAVLGAWKLGCPT
jgi:hypothetical protein